MLTCLRPPTIARQAEAGQLFLALRTAIDAHRAAEKLQSVTATVGAVVAAQQLLQQQNDRQQQQIDEQAEQIGAQGKQIGALQQQVHGLQQHQDEEQEKGEVVRERVEFENSVHFDNSVQAPSTGTAVAGSGSATQPAAATGPAAAGGRRELPPRPDKVELAQKWAAEILKEFRHQGTTKAHPQGQGLGQGLGSCSALGVLPQQLR